MKNETTVRTEIHYAQAGDYQLPLLTLPQIDSREPLGKYARMRLTYLKTQRPVLYNRMLLNGSEERAEKNRISAITAKSAFRGEKNSIIYSKKDSDR